MVYAPVTELRRYVDTSLYERIEGFLKIISADMAEGQYPLLGKRAFARVMSYDTIAPEQGIIEAHNRYVDIQASITGAEGISVFLREELTPTTPYDENGDVELFDSKGVRPLAHTENIPGYFTILFPEDAHRPKEIIRGCSGVKKYVIKAEVALCR